MIRVSGDGPRGAGIAVRVVGGVLTAVFGIPFAVLALMVLASRFGSAEQDPHGYTLIFGTVLAIPLAMVTSLVVPLILPRSRRALGYGIAVIAFLVVTAVLLAAWFTA